MVLKPGQFSPPAPLPCLQGHVAMSRDTGGSHTWETLAAAIQGTEAKGIANILPTRTIPHPHPSAPQNKRPPRPKCQELRLRNLCWRNIKEVNVETSVQWLLATHSFLELLSKQLNISDSVSPFTWKINIFLWVRITDNFISHVEVYLHGKGGNAGSLNVLPLSSLTALRYQFFPTSKIRQMLGDESLALRWDI